MGRDDVRMNFAGKTRFFTTAMATPRRRGVAGGVPLVRAGISSG